MGLRELWGKLIGRSKTPGSSKPTPEEIVEERQEELREADQQQREDDEGRHTTP
jgi:hypothetical protein